MPFQLKNLSESQFRLLCDHYGHTLAVHKRWYRLRDSTTELVKVSQLLMEADHGITSTKRTEAESDDSENQVVTKNKPSSSKEHQSTKSETIQKARKFDKCELHLMA